MSRLPINTSNAATVDRSTLTSEYLSVLCNDYTEDLRFNCDMFSAVEIKKEISSDDYSCLSVCLSKLVYLVKVTMI